MELMKRLADLIPSPWMHLVRYYGVLAPHAKMREQVVSFALACAQDSLMDC